MSIDIWRIREPSRADCVALYDEFERRKNVLQNAVRENQSAESMEYGQTCREADAWIGRFFEIWVASENKFHLEGGCLANGCDTKCLSVRIAQVVSDALVDHYFVFEKSDLLQWSNKSDQGSLLEGVVSRVTRSVSRRAWGDTRVVKTILVRSFLRGLENKS